MNREEFFKAFEKRAKKHGFKMDAYTIREKRTGKCPICAVACEIFKKSTKLDANEDGNKLGLKNTFIDNIVAAADWNTCFADKTCKKYRNKLLKLAGLEPS